MRAHTEEGLMSRRRALTVVAALALAAAVSPVFAQDPIYPDQDSARGAKSGEPALGERRAYVVRLRPGLRPTRVNELIAEAIKNLKERDPEATVSPNVPGLRGILVTTSSPERLRASLPAGFVAEAPPDYTVRLFDGASCGDAMPVQAVQPLTNICRVTGVPTVTAEQWRVWVLDSGLDQTASAAFNIVDRVDCTTGTCMPGASIPSINDDLGHGTMVAGVIAARSFNDSAGTKVGLDGVSPGGAIIPVKVFGGSPSTSFWFAPVQALLHVADNATAGDVVNISWGGPWIGALSKEAFDALSVFDALIARIADKGVRVVIAAGNADPREPLPPWVGFVAPANSRPSHGSASKVNPLGGVYVVSAVNSYRRDGVWRDDFWVDHNGRPLSYFGKGPPDFSQPGVGIRSMWHSEGPPARTAVCSGTSFAAPHLSGLLSRKLIGDLLTSQPNGDPDGTADPVAWIYPTAPCP
jgi:subtilisin family serine protease